MKCLARLILVVITISLITVSSGCITLSGGSNLGTTIGTWEQFHLNPNLDQVLPSFELKVPPPYAPSLEGSFTFYRIILT